MFGSQRNTVITSNPEWIERINATRTYNLVEEKEQKEPADVMFYVIGCAGDRDTAQRQVAELMDKISRAERKPFAIFMLGDNFYNDTLDKLSDEAFKKSFYDVYHQVASVGICGVPFFVILGNHDHGFHYFWRNNGVIDYNTVGIQVMHTYVGADGLVNPDLMQLFDQDTVEIAALPQWNMPSRHYLLRYKSIEFYMIDSNTYVRDYLSSLEKPEEAGNQANWLQREMARYPERIKLLFLHHPLATVGKRMFYTADSSDTRTYLTADEIAKLKKLGIESSYGSMLRMILKKQGLKFDAVFAAHDHDMYYYQEKTENENFCQIVAGGGGGQLQSRESFHYWESVPAFLKEHGFVGVTVDPLSVEKRIQFDIYGVTGTHLRFTNLNAMPLKASSLMEEGVRLLQEMIWSAYQNYFNHLRSKHTTPRQSLMTAIKYFQHGDTGVIRADTLRNYFNQYDAFTFENAMEFLTNIFDGSGSSSEHSLKTFIENELAARFRLTWKDFISKPNAILAASSSSIAEVPALVQSPSNSGVKVESSLPLNGGPGYFSQLFRLSTAGSTGMPLTAEIKTQNDVTSTPLLSEIPVNTGLKQ